jgi:hypothetical protein
MYALPYTYRNIVAEEGTLVEIIVLGDAGGSWYLQKHSNNWLLIADKNKPADCEVIINPDIAWKLFTKGITPDFARENSRINGNIKLGEQVFNMTSVMA